jgi:peptidoglycan/xylan/chitin deacetylase (PgdA/CDA1 family)
VSDSLTLVKYHYVRDTAFSPYPNLKALSVDHFQQQISYFKQRYHFVSLEEVLGAMGAGESLPENALLLTFDDGYSDHFLEVFPVLEREKISACFFPVGLCVLENRVLAANKIHLILACVEDSGSLLQSLFEKMDLGRAEFSLESREFYWSKLASPSRFGDSKEIMFFKRILQRELPENFRNQILDELFHRYVSSDEKAIAEELYMNLDQLRFLKDQGMHVGCHGYHHVWLNHLSPTEQKKELDMSLEFLGKIGVDLTRWTLCYPYGGHDESIIQLAKQLGCVAAFTVEHRVADLKVDNPYVLPRFDTANFPI